MITDENISKQASTSALNVPNWVEFQGCIFTIEERNLFWEIYLKKTLIIRTIKLIQLSVLSYNQELSIHIGQSYLYYFLCDLHVRTTASVNYVECNTIGKSVVLQSYEQRSLSLCVEVTTSRIDEFQVGCRLIFKISREGFRLL